MPPPNGSDSERLMAQIEAYLRTGEGPPAAPEPPPSPAPGPEPEPAGRPPSSRRHRRKAGARLRRARRRAVGRLRGTRVWQRLAAAGRPGREWSGGVMHPAGGHPSIRRSADPPRWTVARVVLVVGFLVALLLVPVIWKKSSSGGSPDGTDHASAAPAGPGYQFLQVNRSGTPVRWNPCDAIYYQLDLAGAPSWAETDIGDAISSISTATGITFVYEGSTNQLPGRPSSTGSVAPEQPVVIAWATPDQSRELNLPVSTQSSTGPTDADSLGRTVPVAADDQVTGHKVYVTGSVVISSAVAQLPDGFGPGAAGVLFLHQLGRLVGLADVNDSSQVMNTGVLSTQVTGLGPGDRAGLKRLGRDSGCLKVPANPVIEPVL